MPKTSNLLAYVGFALILLFSNIAAFSFDSTQNGDGSASSNLNLLRGSYETGCYYPAICGGLLVDPTIDSSNAYTPEPQISNNANSNNIPATPANLANNSALAPISLVPEATYNLIPNYQADVFSPATTFNWSVALKGAYQKDSNGERFETILSPRASVLHKQRNAQYDIGIGADIAKPSDGEYSLRGSNVNFASRMLIDKESLLSFNANVNIGQEDINSLGLANNVTSTPFVLGASANGAIMRRFGKLTGELRLGYNRAFYSNTGLSGGIWQDNSARNINSYSAGLRLTQELTPIINAYVDLAGERNIYDIAPVNFADGQNNWAYNLRAGIRGNWSDILLADISAGYALRQYDSATLSDSPAVIVDANIAYNMGQGLNLSTNFATDITTPDPTSGASLRVGYSLGAVATYQVNDWLNIRASAGGNWASFVGINDIERTYNAGVGLDYALNRQTKLTADYNYLLSEPTPANRRDSHRIELGVTYSR